MMTICNSKDSPNGAHRQEWRWTSDDGGYWICLNAGCGDIEVESTGHHGG